MQRVQTQQQAEAIAFALDYLPDRLAPLAGCDVFCGDPWFAGIHQLRAADNGEPVGPHDLRAHAMNDTPMCDRRRTIVLPEHDIEPITVLHETGHMIEYALFDRVGSWDRMPPLEPVNAYARTLYGETFAESFVQWLYPLEMAHRMLSEGRGGWDLVSRHNFEVWDRLLLD